MSPFRKVLPLVVVLVVLASMGLAACAEEESSPASSPADLHIVSGSENKTLEPIIQRWADEQDVRIDVSYKGSLDIMLQLETGDIAYDAVWPANSIWLNLGDEQHRNVKHAASILRSPVVLGVKRSLAEDLGWIDTEVYVDDILEAAESGQLRLMMTSATQSNSGASAYLAYLYAFAGNPDVLSLEDLRDPAVEEKIKRILGAVDRSSGSSGWLKDACLEQYFRCDAMVNYEALIIEANQELVQRGDEPLYAIYPVDGLAIADSPLGYFDKDDAEKEEIFLQLQEYLLSDDVQEEILSHGRRAGSELIGLSLENADPTIFNPDWGIDVTRTIVPIKFPSPAVLREALNLYQTAFRKSSFTIYCLDFSGSMEDEGERQLKQAMETLLDQQRAAEYLLQASPNDITIVLIFNEGIRNAGSIEQWTVRGNDPADLEALLNRIKNERAGGDTNIYDPAALALRIFEEQGVGNRFPAIILMTDGRSNNGTFESFRDLYMQGERDIPVFAITFGDADTSQLHDITEITYGRIFDGTSDLVAAFRKAKGYN